MDFPHTVEGISQELGITSKEVVEIEERALRRLRHPSRADHLNRLPYGVTCQGQDSCTHIRSDTISYSRALLAYLIGGFTSFLGTFLVHCFVNFLSSANSILERPAFFRMLSNS